MTSSEQQKRRSAQGNGSRRRRRTLGWFLLIAVLGRCDALSSGSSRRMDPVTFSEHGDRALKEALNVSTDLEPFAVVAQSEGVTVYRRDINGSCVVMASSVLEAPLESVVSILRDSSRIREYNANCAEFVELERIDDCDGQITYSISPAMGPFKRRDFVTAVHWRQLEDGSVAVLNHAVEDERAPVSDTAIRSQVVLGAQLLRSDPEDPSRTEMTLLSSLQLGGLTNSAYGAALTNKLAEQEPVTFMRKLEAASRRQGGLDVLPANHHHDLQQKKNSNAHQRQTQQQQQRPWFDSVSASSRGRNQPSHIHRVWSSGSS